MSFAFLADQAFFDLVSGFHLSAFSLIRIDSASASNLSAVLQNANGAQPAKGTSVFLLGCMVQRGTELASRIEAPLSGLVPEALRDGVLFAGEGSRDSAPSVLDWMFQRYDVAGRHLVRAATTSQLALSRLRSEFLQSQASLKQAEEIFAQIKHPGVRVAYAIGPDHTFELPSASLWSRRRSLSQSVSDPIGCISHVDVGLKNLGATAGEVIATLTGAYSGTTFDTWHLPAAKAADGWNRFQCRAPERKIEEPPRVTLELSGIAPGALAVALGAPHPDPAQCARLGDGSRLQRPMALQIWQGIVGMRLPQLHGSILPDTTEAPVAPRTALLSADAMAAVALFHAPDMANSDIVAWSGMTEGILVHPQGSEPVVAVISDIEAATLKAVSASVRLGHAQASITEFAMLAAPHNTLRSSEAERQSMVSEAAANADWVTLGPNEWGEITASIDEPGQERVDLYLMTRNLSEESSLSWAFFSGLTAHYE